MLETNFQKTLLQEQMVRTVSNYLMYRPVREYMSLLIVNSKGIILYRWGGEEMVKWMNNHYVFVGNDISALFPNENAVTVGLAMMNYPGTEVNYATQYHSCLDDRQACFTPIFYNDNGTFLGGIVCVYLEYSRQVNVSDFCFTLSYTIERELDFIAVNAASTAGVMILCVDQYSDDIDIEFINQSLLEMLGISREYVEHNTIQDIFPEHEYKGFYRYIRGKYEVKDLEMSITNGKKKNMFRVTFKPYTPRMINRTYSYVYFSQVEAIAVSEAKENLRIPQFNRFQFGDLTGVSKPFLDVIKELKSYANGNSNLMFIGESGTGKDVMAQAFHNISPRKYGPYVAINCGALSKNLIASELFGYEGGAFSGAKKTGSIGKFEAANGGTLFLDEIESMPLELQVSLLRAIETKSIMKVGGNKVINVDVRIISACNEDIDQLVAEKKFRLDLYYRLNTLTVNIPPLRERGWDIVLIAEKFLDDFNESEGLLADTVLSDDAKQYMCALSWPGNIRQLRNVIEGMHQKYRGQTITKSMLERYMEKSHQSLNLSDLCNQSSEVKQTEETKNNKNQESCKTSRYTKPQFLEPATISEALKLNHYHKGLTAEYLGISRKSLYRKLKEFNM